MFKLKLNRTGCRDKVIGIMCEHKGSGLCVSNTQDRDYVYPTQRIGIMYIQHKGSGLCISSTKDRDYVYPTEMFPALISILCILTFNIITLRYPVVGITCSGINNIAYKSISEDQLEKRTPIVLFYNCNITFKIIRVISKGIYSKNYVFIKIENSRLI